jgi:predicted Zn-dependent peptidase
VRTIVVAALLFVASTARAGIQLSLEPDPLPLVEMTVVIPSGFETTRPEEAGAASVMSDILDAGTAALDRKSYQDRLASFGATNDFTLSNLYSVWTLRFPIVDGKDYRALADLLAENWKRPRLTDETFAIAVRKLGAGLTASLDSDMSLGMSTSRRWADSKFFGGVPITLDRVAALRKQTTAAVWNRDFVGSGEIWAGVVAPPESLPLVKSVLSTVFAAQGEIRERSEPKPLPLREVPARVSGPEQVFLILDKPDRTQTMTSVLAVARDRHGPSDELAAEFGRYVLVGGGLGSIFGQEIRTKRGLAYSVSPVSPSFLGHPALGLATNPVRPRSDEALGVIAKLLDTGYAEPSLIKDLPDETWERQWKSFLYGKLLDRSTPAGRIAERMEVAVGELSPERYQQEMTDWKTGRSEVTSTLEKTWAQSVVVGAVVGDARELEPLVAKHFPRYEVVVIPYRDSILSRTYQ